MSFHLVAAHDQSNSGFNFNGYGGGRLAISVPEGWRVTVTCENRGPLNHSCAIVRGPQDSQPAMPGAASPDPVSGQGPGVSTTIEFTAQGQGTYRIACLGPGHEQGGMWDSFTVGRFRPARGEHRDLTGGVGSMVLQVFVTPECSGCEVAGRRPALETTHDVLTHTYRQSMIDLAALRFRPTDEVTWSLPAAGLPWFMALFGRDAIITSHQALPFQPGLAHTILEALAALQANEFDDFRDAEPGKIPHELRCGELARLGEVPHSPYYGTHDATPLFLVLLDEYELWTGDLELVRRLEPAARAALRWLERFGDPDRDGYLEVRTRSPRGLHGTERFYQSTLNHYVARKRALY